MSREIDQVERMGHTAGQIWNILDREGPMSIAALVKRLGVPRDHVMEGVGWLGREGKITITEEGRSRLIALT